MTKAHPKPSDRGRNSPEPGPVPGTRAEQRDTQDQLSHAPEAGEEALVFEREEQEKLPRRGEGGQHNQGRDKGPTIHDAGAGVPVSAEEAGSGPGPADLHSGGTRGPSNQNR